MIDESNQVLKILVNGEYIVEENARLIIVDRSTHKTVYVFSVAQLNVKVPLPEFMRNKQMENEQNNES